uniref:Uncharacterized protein n=1 Tax=Daucus carota subsp. sativus TaxID=79200 RepID=A0A164UEA1_DAUCS
MVTSSQSVESCKWTSEGLKVSQGKTRVVFVKWQRHSTRRGLKLSFPKLEKGINYYKMVSQVARELPSQ